MIMSVCYFQYRSVYHLNTIFATIAIIDREISTIKP
jgi:hypothetical protein